MMRTVTPTLSESEGEGPGGQGGARNVVCRCPSAASSLADARDDMRGAE